MTRLMALSVRLYNHMKSAMFPNDSSDIVLNLTFGRCALPIEELLLNYFFCDNEEPPKYTPQWIVFHAVNCFEVHKKLLEMQIFNVNELRLHQFWEQKVDYYKDFERYLSSVSPVSAAFVTLSQKIATVMNGCFFLDCLAAENLDRDFLHSYNFRIQNYTENARQNNTVDADCWNFGIIRREVEIIDLTN